MLCLFYLIEKGDKNVLCMKNFRLFINTKTIALFCCHLFLISFLNKSFAADFIIPNSSGEPVVIDISSLNTTSSIDVSVGEFTNQPRPYRGDNTKSFVLFPPPASNSERTIQLSSGSSVITKTVSYRPSLQGNLKLSVLPSLVSGRAGNSVTKISDGRIVLIGGSKSLARDPLNTVEIFDPESGRASRLKTANGLEDSKLKTPRSQHTATYLGISDIPVGMITGPVEQILVIGGFSEKGALKKTIEIVEIKTGTNQGTSTLLSGKKATLKKARIFHTANLLPDGKVLIIGGQGRINQSNLGALNSIEIFDPVTRSISPSSITLNTSRLLHTATLLQNGNILIAGGFTNEKNDDFGSGPATETSELINASDLSIKKVGSFFDDEGAGGHSATLLTNGLVLITGGATDFFASGSGDNAEGITKGTIQFYNPDNETFNLVQTNSGGNLELQSSRFLHSSVLLPNGSVAVVGGLNIKAATNSENLISTPVSSIEVIEPNIINFSGNNLKADKELNIESSVGRVQPSVALITPKNKTRGFLASDDSANFVNSALYITGGFSNGFGKLPTKISELIQIDSNSTVEGRRMKLTPEALIRGGFLGQLLLQVDKFSQVPSVQVEPQTVNLSVSNNFMVDVKVTSSNNELVLLKTESSDSNGSVVVSPALFQSGEVINISRKDSSVQGEFEISILAADSSKDFIEAKVKVNISESSKPFLSTVPQHGVSLSTQDGSSTQKIQLKVLSQDGKQEITTISKSTQVTAMINDPEIANLGGTGISSVTGTLSTQFSVNAIKPGKTSLDFTINFPDVLSVSLPLEVAGTPSFSNNPVDLNVLSALQDSGIEINSVGKIDPTLISFDDVNISVASPLFPFYVPVNFQSSIDNSSITGIFTIRSIYGLDLATAQPRTLLNAMGTDFRESIGTDIPRIGGFVSTDSSKKPVAVIASSDGIRTLNYESASSERLTGQFNMISNLSDFSDLDLFEIGGSTKFTKISLLRGSKVTVINSDDGLEDVSVNLSGDGFEQELVTVDNQPASVVSVGSSGVDLIFPLLSTEPRLVNFKLPGNTKNIAAVETLDKVTGPFVIAYDGVGTLSIVNLLDIDSQIKTINVTSEKITKIAYAGRYKVNGKPADVLVASTQRGVSLFNLNTLASIPVNEDLKIKNEIEDLIIIDGVVYLALGTGGVLGLNVGGLIDSGDNNSAQVVQIKKINLKVVKSSGKEDIISKPLNAKFLADSKPFLLVSGEKNDLSVIRISP